MECINSRVMFIVLLSVIILLVGHVDGRKGPVEYWVEVMQDQPIPEAFEGLLSQRPNEANTKEELIEGSSTKSNETSSQKADCNSHHDGLPSEKLIVNGFEPKPYKDFESRATVSAYNDFEPKPYKDFESRVTVSAYNDFEPKPTISAYKDFESRATVTAYNDFELKPYKDFESRATITAYNDFDPKPYEDFESSATATAYNDFKPKSTISAYKDFESRASATAYNDFEPTSTIST